MKKFWVIYISVAVAGSVAVWRVAPSSGPVLKKFHRKNKVAVNEKTEPVFNKSKIIAAGEFKPDDAISSGASAAGVHKNDNLSVDDPPALLGIFRVTPGHGENPSWGVVRHGTAFYDPKGKRLGEIPGGVILEFIELRKSSKGSMVLCKLRYKGREIGPCLIKQTDVSLFSGSFSDLSEASRNNLQEYYRLKGMMEKRRIALMEQTARKNPHYLKYKSAYERFMDHIEAAGELTGQRDSSTGLKRSRLDDQLRRMKNEEVKLKKEYKQIHDKYKAWKKKHAADLPDIDSDSEIKEYRMRMQQLSRLIPGLAY
ncbi:MAG: hypothetical protein R6V06_02285 [Kiritimatiellia bacterium]